jgi:hypothetical protein
VTRNHKNQEDELYGPIYQEVLLASMLGSLAGDK